MDCLCHRCLTRVNNQSFGLHWCKAHQPALPSMERREERDREGEREERERDIKGKRKKKMIILNKGNNGHLCFTVDQAAKDKRITEQ